MLAFSHILSYKCPQHEKLTYISLTNRTISNDMNNDSVEEEEFVDNLIPLFSTNVLPQGRLVIQVELKFFALLELTIVISVFMTPYSSMTCGQDAGSWQTI